MIIGNNSQFFIQTDFYCDANGFKLGTFNMWINNIMYPRKETNITLEVALCSMIESFESALKFPYTGANLPIDKINFSREMEEHVDLYYSSVDFLYDLGFDFFIEVIKDKVRFFYTQDNSDYKVICFAKNYMKELIELLSKALDELSFFSSKFNELQYFDIENKENNRVDIYKLIKKGQREWYLNVPEFISQVENES